MLTVALDAEHTRQSGGGIARYARSLTAALRAVPDVSVIELGGGSVVSRGTLSKKLLTARQDLLWYPLLARREAARCGADIYHSPLLRGPLSRGRPPFVMTVHDLVPVRWPRTMPRWHRAYTSLVLRRLLDAADRIITPSGDTANDLTSMLGVASEKIRVIHNGVNAFFFDEPASASPLTEPYVLFVGTPEPRKNLPRLTEAMRLLRKRGYQHRLVIAGSGGWGAGTPLSANVESVGRVSDAQLRRLYSGASCLALPSLHEGFGLPAIEAMAAGTPVVAGNSGALPEVSGGAAVLVDPLEPESIADGIEEALSRRDELIARGKVRARDFSWEKAAELTAAVYRELA